jgi:hypothetical protein
MLGRTRPFSAYPNTGVVLVSIRFPGQVQVASLRTQKLIAMCKHWLPLGIANVSLSFLLQRLHVKNINWTLRFGAVASEPANLFNVALASGHKRKVAMVKLFGLCLYPRFLSVCFDEGPESMFSVRSSLYVNPR